MTGRAEISLWITQWFESSSGENIDLEENFFEAGLIDSFGVIEIISYLEKKYKIRINDNEITKEKFGSLNKMSKLVSEKIEI